MSSGLFNKKRDFQVAETMAWHKMTKLEKPTLEHFPIILPMVLHFNGGKEMICGNRKFFVPVAQDDMMPVAPPYCGETIIDDTEEGCEPLAKDKRGSYMLFTPREAWAWVAEVLAGTEYNVESIGMLWNRSFWFISTTLTELQSMDVGDNRKTNFQLNFSGGLDRTVSPQCELSSIVAVCHNTISLSRATGTILFHERATKNFTERLEASKGEVSKAVGMAAVFKAAMDGLAKKKCTKDRARNIFAGFVTPAKDTKMSTRTSNIVDELTELHTNGIGNRGETEFDTLNAYTQRFTRGGADANTPLGRRFVSSEYGNNADAKAEFYKLLTTDRKEYLGQIEFRGKELVAAGN